MKKLFALLLSCIVMQSVHSNEPTAADFSAIPPLLTTATQPLVMLLLSVDHELFKKAYSDYSDLDGDGALDTTYNDGFDYLGYFDSNWCYQHSGGNFQPTTVATGDNNHFCSGQWSGNFLNWASMSRIDVLRTVLYGGKRLIDDNSRTVLERAYIPRDIHAFVKVYNSSLTNISTSQLTPYNNENISLCNVSDWENGVPQLRVANGLWPRWASTEVRQCQWGAQNSPDQREELTTRTLYVERCVAGKDASSGDACKLYDSGYTKPYGLLQQYGETGDIHFGLLTGSYDKNISGGLLRRNIGKIASNDNSQNDEINLQTGQFTNTRGIIHNLDAIRLAKYSYSGNKYLDCDTYGISLGAFKSGRGTTSRRHCSMWGNPISELYLEALRYFAGRGSPSSSFYTNNDGYFTPNLSNANWQDPLNSDNACSNCSIVVLSSGANSFDMDELYSSSDLANLGGVSGLSAKTDEVGRLEFNNAFAGNYLVGGLGTTRQCTPKYLNRLSEAVGLCPEVPQLEGSYQIAGLAFYGQTNDLRVDLPGIQSVKTYAVELAENMPSFSLKANDRWLTFQPTCQASSNLSNIGGSKDFYGGSDCTLTDVIIESLEKNGDGDTVEGSLLFTWEDSLWGNDYDYDASSRIKFCVGNRCNTTTDDDLKTTNLGSQQLRLAVQVDGVEAGLNLRFGYTISGSETQDGAMTDYVFKGSTAFKTKTYTVSGNATGQLPKPLYLAAKYGGFADQDGDNTPRYLDRNSDDREWDNRNNTSGNSGSDGVPDNYFFVRNPTQLAKQLGQVFSDIAGRLSSATNATLLANNTTGIGAIYQALFQPALSEFEDKVSWGGLLHALFIDGKGHIREDSNSNARLDGYDTDKIIALSFDRNTGQTVLQRYNSSDGETLTADGPLRPLSQLNTLWDARDQLAAVQNVRDQRSYSALASSGRHILTWLDNNNDGRVDVGEQQPFTPQTFNTAFDYIADDLNQTTQVVNYIRGEEQSGMRSRRIDYDQDGTVEVWRLGDIVHSTPKVVAAPDGGYDARYNDDSYAAFKQQYKNRRHVLYVGANDGLIHAFNSGFWRDSDFSYQRGGGNGEVAHPLGTELWSYAPMNLLPHLRWLTEPDYPHVYYMDAEPYIVDAKIFNNDATHPNGWGTVLVMGMRLGGGEISRTINGVTKTFRSAYVLMDITNPEVPPTLLAEITHPQLGFTTSQPTLIKRGTNGWYLAFASGPYGNTNNSRSRALRSGESNQTAKLFLYDLTAREFVNGFAPLNTGQANSYGGDLITADVDQDYNYDVIYLGSANTGSNPLRGSLLRLSLATPITDSQLTTALANTTPIVAAPEVVLDRNDYWVYAGTGRLLTADDNRDTQINYVYGLRQEPQSTTTVAQSSLVDVTNISVFTDGSVRQQRDGGYAGVEINGNTVSNFEALKATISSGNGWRRALTAPANSPSSKSINRIARLHSQLFFTAYQPPADQCSVEGSSELYSVHYQTGTASWSPVLGSQTVQVINPEDGERVELDESLNQTDVGAGYVSSPVVHQGENNQSRVITQGAGGSIILTDVQYNYTTLGRQSWRRILNPPPVQ